jgi:hypothetical protein
LLTLLCVWFFHAPLENHADPQVTPLHTTAPWYFLWLQGMLKLGDKVLMGVVLPTIIFGFLFVMPYLDLTPSRRYAHRRVALSLGMVTVAVLVVLTYMGTPHYGVDTAANDEVAQELIPMEGVGPVRAIPYDELVSNLTVLDPVNTIWLSEIDALKNANRTGEFDSTVAPRSIVITEDNLEELEDRYADNYPELWHTIEEFHERLFETYDDQLPNAIGYLSISQKQPGLVRIYLLMTWDVPKVDSEGEIIVKDGKTELLLDEEGQPIRSISGKIVFVHEESEWHAH